jgi:hypothetical protein
MQACRGFRGRRVGGEPSTSSRRVRRASLSTCHREETSHRDASLARMPHRTGVSGTRCREDVSFAAYSDGLASKRKTAARASLERPLQDRPNDARWCLHWESRVGLCAQRLTWDSTCSTFNCRENGIQLSGGAAIATLRQRQGQRWWDHAAQGPHRYPVATPDCRPNWH